MEASPSLNRYTYFFAITYVLLSELD